MPDDTPRSLTDRSRYLVRTAHHMADAVDFLIGVAQDSGMRAIAAKLAMVRSDLMVEASGRQAPGSRAENDIDADPKDVFGDKYN